MSEQIQQRPQVGYQVFQSLGVAIYAALFAGCGLVFRWWIGRKGTTDEGFLDFVGFLIGVSAAVGAVALFGVAHGLMKVRPDED